MTGNRATIDTTYISPTDTTGAKVRATCNGRTLTIPYPYEARDARVEVAQRLARSLGYSDELTIVGHSGRRTTYTVAIPTSSLVLTREQLSAWAGRELTDDDMAGLNEAIPHSSIPDSIAAIIAGMDEIIRDTARRIEASKV